MQKKLSLQHEPTACDWSSIVQNEIYNKRLADCSTFREEGERSWKKELRKATQQVHEMLNIDFQEFAIKFSKYLFSSSFTSPVTPFSWQSSFRAQTLFSWLPNIAIMRLKVVCPDWASYFRVTVSSFDMITYQSDGCVGWNDLRHNLINDSLWAKPFYILNTHNLCSRTHIAKMPRARDFGASRMPWRRYLKRLSV